VAVESVRGPSSSIGKPRRLNLLPGWRVVGDEAARPGAFWWRGPRPGPIHYTSGCLRRAITGGLRGQNNRQNRPAATTQTSNRGLLHVEAPERSADQAAACWMVEPGAGARANPSQQMSPARRPSGNDQRLGASRCIREALPCGERPGACRGRAKPNCPISGLRANPDHAAAGSTIAFQRRLDPLDPGQVSSSIGAAPA